ncbi:MAG: AI-2E family transporter [Eubacterium sp.]|nr:AI-2E family transporter [Eubacterium sp.]
MEEDDKKKKKRFDFIDLKLMFTLAGAGCVIVLFYMLIGKSSEFFGVITRLLRAMSPIIVGCIIAFLLNPIVNRFRNDLKKPLTAILKKSSEEKITRISHVLSVILAMIMFLAVITALLWILIPSLYESINKLYENLDSYANNLENFVTKLLKDNPELSQLTSNYMEDIEDSIRDVFTNELLPNMDTVVKSITNGIVGGLKLILNFLVGVIAAIYILLSKDKLSAQGKKIIYALFNRERGNAILKSVDYIDGVFSGFISGKIVDSIIIGFICFIFCTIVGMPYALLISAIVGVTNFIPFFGPFIGAIPSAVLVFVESPKMCVVFIIFIIILQQVDGNIIGPLILGDSTGLSSFWVLFAILVGGNLFGFTGMVLGVPTFACIYTMLTIYLRDSLNKKGLENDTEYFVALREIDEEGNPVKGPKKKIESSSVKKKRAKKMMQLQHSKEFLDKVTHHDNKKQ